MDTNSIADIRDIKGLVPLPGWPWWVWALMAVAVVLIGLLAWWLSRRKPAAEQPIPPVLPTPYQIALRALEALWNDRPVVEVFYTKLSDIVRRYLEDRFALHAPERTTEEFLGEGSRNGALSVAHRQLLGEFLQEADLVKFARFRPGDADMKRAYDAAESFVRETK